MPALLVLSGALAGCASDNASDPDVARAVADTRPMTWAPGAYWAYHAVYRENQTFDIALIVHETTDEGFHLGTNSSYGFFGLPFTGNVTHELNPRIGPDEWPLYDFPLHDGKTWSYHLFGYDAKTVARAALVEVPGVGEVPGFTFEASAYGQVFARYDYAVEAGWFTRLELIEPTDGTTVLDVTLTAFGPDFGQAYYIEETLREVAIEYPRVPAQVDVRVPSGYTHVRAFLTVRSDAGVVEAELKDGSDGRTLADARAVAKGVASERTSARGEHGVHWVLDHRGVGLGLVHLEVTGITSTGLAPPAPAQRPPPEVDLAALLQSTRPERPHTGHVTSTGSPVAV